MNIKWGVGICALIVLGWGGLVLVGWTPVILLHGEQKTFVISGSLDNNSYLAAYNYPTLRRVDISVRLLQVNTTFVPGNVSICIVPGYIPVNTILNNFKDTSAYSPYYFAAFLLDSGLESISISYNNTISGGTYIYCFGGNASTGAGYWNDNQINVELNIRYEWQDLDPQYALIFEQLFIAIAIAILLAVLTLIALRKKWS